MRDFQVGLQLYAGAKELGSFSAGEIENRICRAREITGFDRLMIWTDYDIRFYEQLIGCCRACGVAPYLWFPVLADVQGTSIDKDDLMVNYDGSRGYGKTGAWKSLGSGAESFLFYCPNREGAVESVFRVYKETLDRLDFAGVLLDRIRFPSAVNGLETLFGCYCDACDRKFRRAHGVSLETQREAVVFFLSRLARVSAPEARGWRSFEGMWEHAGLGKLFDFRKKSIARIVERFSKEARGRGLQVGLDLYSYSLAPLVGQDYGLLSRAADWIKPMIYCRAVGPAGLPLELACLQEALGTVCSELGENGAKQLLMDLLGWEWPGGGTELLQAGLGEQVITSELQKIAAGNLSGGARILTGIEAVRNPDFHIDITEQILERYLARGLQGTAGIVASWNLLYIPDENLKAIAAFKRQEG
jgi:hypothetical protein